MAKRVTNDYSQHLDKLERLYEVLVRPENKRLSLQLLNKAEVLLKMIEQRTKSEADNEVLISGNAVASPVAPQLNRPPVLLNLKADTPKPTPLESNSSKATDSTQVHASKQTSALSTCASSSSMLLDQNLDSLLHGFPKLSVMGLQSSEATTTSLPEVLVLGVMASESEAYPVPLPVNHSYQPYEPLTDSGVAITRGVSMDFAIKIPQVSRKPLSASQVRGRPIPVLMNRNTIVHTLQTTNPSPLVDDLMDEAVVTSCKKKETTAVVQVDQIVAPLRRAHAAAILENSRRILLESMFPGEVPQQQVPEPPMIGSLRRSKSRSETPDRKRSPRRPHSRSPSPRGGRRKTRTRSRSPRAVQRPHSKPRNRSPRNSSPRPIRCFNKSSSSPIRGQSHERRRRSPHSTSFKHSPSSHNTLTKRHDKVSETKTRRESYDKRSISCSPNSNHASDREVEESYTNLKEDASSSTDTPQIIITVSEGKRRLAKPSSRRRKKCETSKDVENVSLDSFPSSEVSQEEETSIWQRLGEKANVDNESGAESSDDTALYSCLADVNDDELADVLRSVPDAFPHLRNLTPQQVKEKARSLLACRKTIDNASDVSDLSDWSPNTPARRGAQVPKKPLENISKCGVSGNILPKHTEKDSILSDLSDVDIDELDKNCKSKDSGNCVKGDISNADDKLNKKNQWALVEEDPLTDISDLDFDELDKLSAVRQVSDKQKGFDSRKKTHDSRKKKAKQSDLSDAKNSDEHRNKKQKAKECVINVKLLPQSSESKTKSQEGSQGQGTKESKTDKNIGLAERSEEKEESILIDKHAKTETCPDTISKSYSKKNTEPDKNKRTENTSSNDQMVRKEKKNSEIEERDEKINFYNDLKQANSNSAKVIEKNDELDSEHNKSEGKSCGVLQERDNASKQCSSKMTSSLIDDKMKFVSDKEEATDHSNKKHLDLNISNTSNKEQPPKTPVPDVSCKLRHSMKDKERLNELNKSNSKASAKKTNVTPKKSISHEKAVAKPEKTTEGKKSKTSEDTVLVLSNKMPAPAKITATRTSSSDSRSSARMSFEDALLSVDSQPMAKQKVVKKKVNVDKSGQNSGKKVLVSTVSVSADLTKADEDQDFIHHLIEDSVVTKGKTQTSEESPLVSPKSSDELHVEPCYKRKSLLELPLPPGEKIMKTPCVEVSEVVLDKIHSKAPPIIIRKEAPAVASPLEPPKALAVVRHPLPLPLSNKPLLPTPMSWSRTPVIPSLLDLPIINRPTDPHFSYSRPPAGRWTEPEGEQLFTRRPRPPTQPLPGYSNFHATPRTYAEHKEMKLREKEIQRQWALEERRAQEEKERREEDERRAKEDLEKRAKGEMDKSHKEAEEIRKCESTMFQNEPRCRKQVEPASDTDEKSFHSPLISLYGTVAIPKTGKGYGKQSFRIPKKGNTTALPSSTTVLQTAVPTTCTKPEFISDKPVKETSINIDNNMKTSTPQQKHKTSLPSKLQSDVPNVKEYIRNWRSNRKKKNQSVVSDDEDVDKLVVDESYLNEREEVEQLETKTVVKARDPRLKSKRRPTTEQPLEEKTGDDPPEPVLSHEVVPKAVDAAPSDTKQETVIEPAKKKEEEHSVLSPVVHTEAEVVGEETSTFSAITAPLPEAHFPVSAASNSFSKETIKVSTASSATAALSKESAVASIVVPPTIVLPIAETLSSTASTSAPPVVAIDTKKLLVQLLEVLSGKLSVSGLSSILTNVQASDEKSDPLPQSSHSIKQTKTDIVSLVDNKKLLDADDLSDEVVSCDGNISDGNITWKAGRVAEGLENSSVMPTLTISNLTEVPLINEISNEADIREGVDESVPTLECKAVKAIAEALENSSAPILTPISKSSKSDDTVKHAAPSLTKCLPMVNAPLTSNVVPLPVLKNSTDEIVDSKGLLKSNDNVVSDDKVIPVLINQDLVSLKETNANISLQEARKVLPSELQTHSPSHTILILNESNPPEAAEKILPPSVSVSLEMAEAHEKVDLTQEDAIKKFMEKTLQTGVGRQALVDLIKTSNVLKEILKISGDLETKTHESTAELAQTDEMTSNSSGSANDHQVTQSQEVSSTLKVTSKKGKKSSKGKKVGKRGGKAYEISEEKLITPRITRLQAKSCQAPLIDQVNNSSESEGSLSDNSSVTEKSSKARVIKKKKSKTSQRSIQAKFEFPDDNNAPSSNKKSVKSTSKSKGVDYVEVDESSTEEAHSSQPELGEQSTVESKKRGSHKRKTELDYLHEELGSAPLFSDLMNTSSHRACRVGSEEKKLRGSGRRAAHSPGAQNRPKTTTNFDDDKLNMTPKVVLAQLRLDLFGHPMRSRNVARRGGHRSMPRMVAPAFQPNQPSALPKPGGLFLIRNILKSNRLKGKNLRPCERPPLGEIIKKLRPSSMGNEVSLQAKMKNIRKKPMGTMIVLKNGRVMTMNDLKLYAFPEGDEVKDCLLCEDKGLKAGHVTVHYKDKHPDSEVLISRLSVTAAMRAVKEARQMATLDILPPKRRKEMWKCLMCSKILSTLDEETLFVHISEHTGEHRWQCSAKGCDATSLTRESLRSHADFWHFNIRKKLFNTEIELFPLPAEFGHVFGYLCMRCNFVQTMRRNVEYHVSSLHAPEVSNVEIVKIDLFLRIDESNVVVDEKSKLFLAGEQIKELHPIDTPDAGVQEDDDDNDDDDHEDGEAISTATLREKASTAHTPKKVTKKTRGTVLSSPENPETTVTSASKSLPRPLAEEKLAVPAKRRAVARKQTGAANLRRMKEVLLRYHATQHRARVVKVPPTTLTLGPLTVKSLANRTTVYECIKGCVFSANTMGLYQKHVESTHRNVDWDHWCPFCSLNISSGPDDSCPLSSALSHMGFHMKDDFLLAPQSAATQETTLQQSETAEQPEVTPSQPSHQTLPHAVKVENIVKVEPDTDLTTVEEEIVRENKVTPIIPDAAVAAASSSQSLPIEGIQHLSDITITLVPAKSGAKPEKVRESVTYLHELCNKPSRAFLRVKNLEGDLLSTHIASSSTAVEASESSISSTITVPVQPVKLTTIGTPMSQSIDLVPVTLASVRTAVLEPVPEVEITPAPLPQITSVCSYSQNEQPIICSPRMDYVQSHHWNGTGKPPEVLREMLVESKLMELYKCMGNKCSFTGNILDVFKEHCRLHEFAAGSDSDRSWWRCAYCSLALGPEKLGDHISVTHGQCAHQCRHCFYRAVCSEYLESHQRVSHQEERHEEFELKCVVPKDTNQHVDPPKEISFAKQYICHMCKRRFKKPKDFTLHLNTHDTVYHRCFHCPFICRSSTIEQLVKHYRQHGVMKYHCPYCDFGGDTRDEVKIHLSIRHFTCKPYVFTRDPKDKDKQMPVLSYQEGEEESPVMAELRRLSQEEQTTPGRPLLPNAHFSRGPESTLDLAPVPSRKSHSTKMLRNKSKVQPAKYSSDLATDVPVAPSSCSEEFSITLKNLLSGPPTSCITSSNSQASKVNSAPVTSQVHIQSPPLQIIPAKTSHLLVQPVFSQPSKIAIAIGHAVKRKASSASSADKNPSVLSSGKDASAWNLTPVTVSSNASTYNSIRRNSVEQKEKGSENMCNLTKDTKECSALPVDPRKENSTSAVVSSYNDKLNVSVENDDDDDIQILQSPQNVLMNQMVSLRTQMLGETEDLLKEEVIIPKAPKRCEDPDVVFLSPIATVVSNLQEQLAKEVASKKEAEEIEAKEVEKFTSKKKKGPCPKRFKIGKEKEDSQIEEIGEPSPKRIKNKDGGEKSNEEVQIQRAREQSSSNVKEKEESQSQRKSELSAKKRKIEKELFRRNLYKCGNHGCDFDAENVEELRDHLVICNLDVLLACHVCPYKTKSADGYLIHLQKHSGIRFKCTRCEKCFLYMQIQGHVRHQHKCATYRVDPVDPLKNDLEIDFFTFEPLSASNKKKDQKTKKKLLKETVPHSRMPPPPTPVLTVPTSLPSTPDVPCSLPPTVPSPTATKRVYYPENITSLPMSAVYSEHVTCGLCPYSTKVRSNMVRHLNLHSRGGSVPSAAPTNPVPCLDGTGKMFDKMTNLAASSLLDREPVESLTLAERARLPPAIPDQQRYKCGECHHITTDEKMLHSHITALHSEVEHYNCPHCPTIMAEHLRIVSLEQMPHHLKHHDTKLFKCAHCDFFHFLKQAVERHLADTHADRRQYVHTVREPATLAEPVKMLKCTYCSFTCGASLEMSNHLRRAHEIKGKFKCKECMFVSKTVGVFASHNAKCHGGRKVKWEKCYNMTTGTGVVEPTVVVVASPVAATTPIWQRDVGPRMIRGIPIDAEEEVTQKEKRQRDNPCYHCPLCSFTCMAEDDYRHHLFNELNYVQFACEGCTCKFFTMPDASKHASGTTTPHNIVPAEKNVDIDKWVEACVSKQKQEMSSGQKAKKIKTSQEVKKKVVKTQSPVAAESSTAKTTTAVVPTEKARPVLLQCPHCQDWHRSVQSLKTHITYEHIRMGRYICPHCSKTYTTPAVVNKHALSVHKESLPKPVMNPDVEMFTLTNAFWEAEYGLTMKNTTKCVLTDHVKEAVSCSQCNWRGSRQGLDVHAVTTHRFRDGHWWCDVQGCEFNALTEKELQEHDKSHCWKMMIANEDHKQTEVPTRIYNITFSCRTCSLKFLTENELTRHSLEAHDLRGDVTWDMNNTVLQCGYCLMVCKTRASALRHWRLVHSELAFVVQHTANLQLIDVGYCCPHCNFKCNSLIACEAHMESHMCGSCPCVFKLEDELENHRKRSNHVKASKSTNPVLLRLRDAILVEKAGKVMSLAAAGLVFSCQPLVKVSPTSQESTETTPDASSSRQRKQKLCPVKEPDLLVVSE